MRKISLFISLIFLFGCEKYVGTEPFKSPNLTGGKWIFTDYDIVVTSSISGVTVIENDTICINSFNNQSFVSGGVKMLQNYIQTAKDRRFIKGKTIWEFDNNNHHLFCDFININGSIKPSHEAYWVNIYENSKRMSVDNLDNGGATNYTYDVNNVNPTVMKLLSPSISTDLYLSNGNRDKAVTVRILLTFMR
jgi:hypothetical protein